MRLNTLEHCAAIMAMAAKPQGEGAGGFRFVAKEDKTAEIFIYADIGASWWGEGMTANRFKDELKDLGDVTQIDVHINSYGGDVFDGMAIYQLLVQHKAKIVVYIDGIAASISSVIAMAGEEINIAESGFLMIHDAWTIAAGNADDLRAVADQLSSTSDAIAGVYAKRTGKEQKAMRKLMLQETWLQGQAAVDEGLADKVSENQIKVAARARPDWAQQAYAHMPKSLTAQPTEITTPNRDALRDTIIKRRAAMAARTK